MSIETPTQQITTCSLKGFNPYKGKDGQDTTCRDLSGINCGYGRINMEAISNARPLPEGNRMCLFEAAKESILGRTLGEIQQSSFLQRQVAQITDLTDQPVDAVLADIMTDEQIFAKLAYAARLVEYHNKQVKGHDFYRRELDSQERAIKTCEYWQKSYLYDIAYLIKTGRLGKVLGEEGIGEKLKEVQFVIAPFSLVGHEPDTAPRD
jgi:hypothetical protein